MSFWYHMPFEAVAALPLQAFAMYLRELPVRMAELKMMLAEVIAMPYMKTNDREEMIRHWQDAAKMEEPVRVARPEILAFAGIGVRHVKPRRSGS